jgi:AcrR family transcriptional regulator
MKKKTNGDITMAVKEDLRVQRTKKALSEAFIKLLEEKPFDEITINELCDEAGVRRTTFYKHYKDKHDFLSAYARSLRDMFDKEIWPTYTSKQAKDYFVHYAVKAVEFIDENEKAVNNIIRSSAFAPALSIIVAQNYNDTLVRLREGIAGGLKVPCRVEVTASMLSGGIFVAIFSWLFDGKPTPAEELAENVGNFVAAALSN